MSGSFLVNLRITVNGNCLLRANSTRWKENFRRKLGYSSTSSLLHTPIRKKLHYESVVIVVDDIVDAVVIENVTTVTRETM